ncbi:PDDEXK nuclease domain-containing protein [Leptothoe sp. LEGE 181152]|nr:PDDEXK nuclease domain-containing protein [Leptothoe sp. LEGE 181152]
MELLGIAQAVHERELERTLIARPKDFLIELGYGFCFIGNQYRLVLGDNEYFLNLLFYHRFLKCLVAIELKTGRFRPEYAGKMDFYLEVLNDQERAPGDNPAIGIILCAEKDRLEVEFSLKSKANPIGVATYQLFPEVPEEYKGMLPTDDDWQKLLESALSEEEQTN